jgi:4-amino-4-deoxy-L-arabinose transferase-like glycosyltransferase
VTTERRQLQRWIIAGLSFFAFAWRIRGLSSQSLWRDEIDAIYFALRDLPETLSMFVNTAQNGALFFLSLRPWLRLVGTSEFALRYPSVLFGMLSVALLWQVGRRLIPGRSPDTLKRRSRLLLELTIGSAPVLATAFLAVNPYLTWYSQDGKMYALTPFLALLVAWLWLQGIGRGSWRSWLGYLAVVSIAIYSHLLMVLLIPLGVTWFVIAWPQSREHKTGYLLALAGLTLPYLPMIWWQWSFLTSPDRLTAIPVYSFPELLDKVLITQSYGVGEPRDLLGVAPVLFLVAAGLLLGFLEISPRPDGPLARLSAHRRHLLIVTWLLVPVFGIYLLSERQPVFNPHYIIWIAPAGVMLVALGVQLLWNNSGSLAKPLAVVLAAYVLLFWAVTGQQQKIRVVKPDLREAVAAVARNRQQDDLLIFQLPHMQYSYRYYSGDQGPDVFRDSEVRLGRWTDGLWTNNGLPDAETRELVDQEMAQKTAGAEDIWLMLSEAELWDERGLMIEWLDDRALLIDHFLFSHAEVRHYRLP